MQLTLARSILRNWRTTDAPSLIRHANNPKIARHLRDAFPHPYTAEAAARWLDMATAQHDGAPWILAIEVGGEAVGGIGVFILEDVYRCGAEIGYWLGEEHWGRGIVTEAVRVLSDAALAELPIERLQAAVYATNLASMRVLEKAGFHMEGIRRKAVIKGGEILDEHMYCRLV